MTDISVTPKLWAIGLWRGQKVWITSAAILAALALFDPAQAQSSLTFAVTALLGNAPFLVFSIAIAAWVSASGADNLIARAFTGAPLTMVVLAALIGAVSPFCSCGAIPLVAALLSMGVPLSAVMAFWLSSPIMDPSMFVLTAGGLGVEFAIAKTIAAVGLGLMGGPMVHAFSHNPIFSAPLRDGIGNGGCGGVRVRAPKAVVWRFWEKADSVQTFRKTAISTTVFLAQWLVLAFLLESLMLAWIPAELIAKGLGGEGVFTILGATLVGVPAYLNGYAALPLVGGLNGQGMAPGAGLAFLVAGGVTSLPAAIAVWALARPPVFAAYIALSFVGAFASGLLFQLWLGFAASH